MRGGATDPFGVERIISELLNARSHRKVFSGEA
jgi:hypothetical protein